MTQMEEKKKKKFEMPHTYIILIVFAMVMAVLTYVVPAGEYVRVEDPSTGRQVIDPESFHYVESDPVTPFEFIKAYPEGMNKAANVTLFVFITGGSFGIIMETGSVNKALGRLAIGMKGKERLLIPLVIFIFSLGGATFGMWEEMIPFIPLGVVLARSVGYDALVGAAMIITGAACGFSSGWMNPFTTGIAQGIAELPLFSGIGYRLIIWASLVVVTSLYIMRYAAKIKKNPELSIVADIEREEANNKLDLEHLEKLSARDYMVLATFVGGMGVMIYGVSKYGWFLTEIGAIFLTMGALCGLFAGNNPSKVASQFVTGAKGICFGALVAGVARAAVVIMESGSIIDTAVYGLSGLIGDLPPALAAAAMYWVQIGMDFVINSGSGQAAATMPIMVPIADVLGITRQTAVLCFQFGDSFTNAFWPTAGTLMACLGIAKISYDRWLKFFIPLIGIWFVMASCFCAYGAMTEWGPF
ncbi:MAG: putative basic amino acid antiporter YfcC [Lachnoclostridium sp.]|nr:putative basic amino acid antiporter YfcC [Lachnoclostridium sp.]MBQ6686543.1 YfcC family protein [Bacillota bacterium]